ncbi:MAG TPA: hypothetical protein VFG43_06365 [Geminicoccaceae bacterium]|nr:hypothetical protein [Geminicoccaceae bacterium]
MVELRSENALLGSRIRELERQLRRRTIVLGAAAILGALGAGAGSAMMVLPLLSQEGGAALALAEPTSPPAASAIGTDEPVALTEPLPVQPEAASVAPGPDERATTDGTPGEGTHTAEVEAIGDAEAADPVPPPVLASLEDAAPLPVPPQPPADELRPTEPREPEPAEAAPSGEEVGAETAGKVAAAEERPAPEADPPSVPAAAPLAREASPDPSPRPAGLAEWQSLRAALAASRKRMETSGTADDPERADAAPDAPAGPPAASAAAEPALPPMLLSSEELPDEPPRPAAAVDRASATPAPPATAAVQDPAPSGQPPPDGEAGDGAVYTVTVEANLRSAPRNDAEVLAVIARGGVVRSVGQSGSWHRVVYADRSARSLDGWLHGRLVRPARAAVAGAP